MADNTVLNAGSGGDSIATDDIAGVKFQRVKITLGNDGVNNGDVSTSNPVPITLGSKSVSTLLSAVTTNQTSAATSIKSGPRTIQGSIAGTGTISATLSWYGSNINSTSGGVLLATMSLAGTTTDVSGSAIIAEWPYMYVILTLITGTSAAVTATVGV